MRVTDPRLFAVWLFLFLLILPMPSNFREINSTREGRNIGEMLSFIQDMFASNDSTEAEVGIETPVVPEINNTAILPEISNQASLILKERFKQLLRDIPTDIDEAVRLITEKQAKSNMLDYTVAAAFIWGAAFDTAADFFLEERAIWEFLTDTEYIYLNGFLWGYAIGFGGPFWIGVENPRQDCGAENFADVIQTLDFDLDRIVNLTDSKRYVLTRQFRFEKETKIFCVTSKIDSSKEASMANTKMDELLNIISKYATMRLKVDGPAAEFFPLEETRAIEVTNSLDDLDQELQRLFDGFEKQIKDAYDNAYASKVSDNLIKIVIGIPNLLGMIFGILMAAEGIDEDGLPGIFEVPGVLTDNFNNWLENGTVSNEMAFGELLSIMGHQGWGYGYYAPYFTRLEDPDPGCGIHDFMDIVRSYRDLSNFRAAFGTPEQILEGSIKLTVDNLPEYIKYRIERFSGEMRVGLQCLLTRVDKSSYDLLFSLESWLDLAIYRTDLYAELMNIL